MKPTVYAIGCSLMLLGTSAGVEAQLIVAHRGASHDAPENTLASFRLAWDQQADAIEGDFYLTRDHQIVCSHDPTTERVGTVNVSIEGSTFKELQGVDVGSWKDPRFRGERIPRLSDVLAIVPADKRIFIEIKGDPAITPYLVQVLDDCRVTPKRATVISFKEDVIRAVKQQMPSFSAYWLVSFEKPDGSDTWLPSMPEVIQKARALGADGVDLNANTEVVTPEAVKLCHEAGLSVHVWTIDDVEKAATFLEMGVDSITTNQPEVLRKGVIARSSADAGASPDSKLGIDHPAWP